MERVLAVVMVLCYLPSIVPHWRSVQCLMQNTAYMCLKEPGCLDRGADLLIAKLISAGLLSTQTINFHFRKETHPKLKPNSLPKGKNDY